jgi:hypothetical protein
VTYGSENDNGAALPPNPCAPGTVAQISAIVPPLGRWNPAELERLASPPPKKPGMGPLPMFGTDEYVLVPWPPAGEGTMTATEVAGAGYCSPASWWSMVRLWGARYRL